VTDFLQSKVNEQLQFLKKVEEESRIDKVKNAPLIRDARVSIGMAQNLIDRGLVNTQGPAINKDIRFAFGAHLKAANKSLIMACGEDALREGLDFLQRQSELGGRGGHARWEGYKPIKSVFEILAASIDALDDWVPTNELWPDFFSYLDMLDLKPEEIEHETDKQKDVITWKAGKTSHNGKTYKISAGKFSRGAFKNKISNIRKPSS